MHICFLSHEYPLWATGGVGSFIQTYGTALVERGHRITVAGIGRSKVREELNDHGIRIVRLPRSSWHRFQFVHNVWQIRRFLIELNQSQPIDFLETPESGLAFLNKTTPYKKIIRLHGGHHFFAEAENRGINCWKGLQEKWSFKKADAFIAVSEYVKHHTAKYLSYHNRPVSVVPLPLDTKLFSPQDSCVVPERLVFAGTVCEKKGVRQLLLAMSIVIRQFPNVQLEIYGRDWFDKNSNSYIKELKATIDSEILRHVNFHGPVKRTEMPNIFRSAELCVFPSHMETLGLVAPEAMLTGRPVLFTITGPGPETIIHEKTGLLCNPHDEKDIADKIIYALSHRKEMELIARQGMEYARQKFDLRHTVHENIEIMERLCQ